MSTWLSKAAFFLCIIYQKGIIYYSLMVLTQWKVWDLFKTYIVKLNLMYLKSTYLYIVSCSMLCITLIQHCFPVLICENTSSRIFCFQKRDIAIELEKRKTLVRIRKMMPMASIQYWK